MLAFAHNQLKQILYAIYYANYTEELNLNKIDFKL